VWCYSFKTISGGDRLLTLVRSGQFDLLCLSARLSTNLETYNASLLHHPPQEFLHSPFIRKQGNIYKPNNKDMDNDSMSGMKTMQDVHTKEIDLVNRDPKHINDDVVKVSP
jgi:hypothetical protein